MARAICCTHPNPTRWRENLFVALVKVQGGWIVHRELTIKEQIEMLQKIQAWLDRNGEDGLKITEWRDMPLKHPEDFI